MVLEYGIPIDTVYDNLEFCDIENIFEYQHYRAKTIWEATRWIAWSVFSANRKNMPKMSEWYSFPWEQEENDFKPDFDSVDYEKLQAEAQAYINSTSVSK